MKHLFAVLALVAVALSSSTSFAAGGGFGGEPFIKQVCYVNGGTGAGSLNSPKALTAGDVMAIPAGTVIEGVQIVLITAVTGSSPQLNVGDDDDADGYFDDGDATEATPAVYIGATSSGYSDTFGKGKYYAAVGKEIKLAFGGTVSVGKFCVVVKGYRVK